jgi:DNA-binding NtrC family response regulator
MPTLDERLRDTPGELRTLLQAIARRVAGDEAADWLAETAERWITAHLGPGYPWPGNVRELEQCVRNLLIRGEYRPRLAPVAPSDARRELAEAILGGTLTANELVQRYCTVVYAETGSYVETARQLGLDRRTVRERIDAGRLRAVQAEDGGANGGDGTPAGDGA